MTANEQRFLELELKVLLNRLRKNREMVPEEELKTTYRKAYDTLRAEIRKKAVGYMKELIFTGASGVYLQGEIPKMIKALEAIVNAPVMNQRMQEALFKEMDMEQMKRLALEIKRQVEPLLTEYQKHAKEGE